MTTEQTRAAKAREKKLISPLQRNVGLSLIVVGVLILLVGLFGYLAGDWQIAPLSWMTDQVFIAREVATSTGTAISGAFDMDGEESGAHIFYASLSGTDESVISAEDFDAELRSRSPYHVADRLPKIPYTVFHCEDDSAVNIDAHSVKFVERMRELGHDVTFVCVPGRGHCDLDDASEKLFAEAVLSSFR